MKRFHEFLMLNTAVNQKAQFHMDLTLKRGFLKDQLLNDRPGTFKMTNCALKMTNLLMTLNLAPSDFELDSYDT